MTTSTPPPLPSNYVTTIAEAPIPHQRPNQNNEPKSKGDFLSWTSVVIAAMGILPLLFFFFACIDGGPGLPTLIFFLIGLIFHGIGSITGFFACLYGSKKIGLLGIIGNAIVMVASILIFLLGMGFNRY
jgi:hypothetical protein